MTSLRQSGGRGFPLALTVQSEKSDDSGPFRVPFMSSTVSTTTGNMVVVTHVNPEQQNLVGVQKFVKGQPLALGTVQILVGVMIFLFGIAMAPEGDTLGIHSGIFVWGAAFSIVAGSLTVAAAGNLNRCLVKCAMAFSIVSAVAAAGAVILHFLDLIVLVLFARCGHECLLFKSRIEGISGVLAVFNLLQMIVSIVVAAYGCCATCDRPEESWLPGETAEMQRVKGEASAMIPPHPPAYNV